MPEKSPIPDNLDYIQSNLGSISREQSIEIPETVDLIESDLLVIGM